MTHELLNGLTPAEMDQVLALGTRITVPSGTSPFRLGDPSDCLFLIERGQIRLTLPMKVRGQEQDVLIEEKSPGQTVGWSALIPPYRFILSATASLESELIALSREKVLAFIEASPAIGRKITFNLAVVIGRRLQLVQAMWLREMQRTVQLHVA
ncbi:MAG TPA: cyclic nucleotide-binding domain-containing protein [Candidatus Angelobacter sp.]|jgi:CRP-like cAMP-binding protein|nr:cyclic nucleotide-binding domain-containing protein [Candidatus Angelobacter sp.]